MRASTCSLASPKQIISFNTSTLTENDAQTCQIQHYSFPNTLPMTIKITGGDRNLLFPKSTRDASNSSSILLRDSCVFGCSDWLYQVTCLLPLSDPIGMFKLIVSFLFDLIKNFLRTSLSLDRLYSLIQVNCQICFDRSKILFII